jgi:DNA-binding CsgD family transcriptional regulator
MIGLAGLRKPAAELPQGAIATAAMEALNRLAHGVVMVDRDSNVHFINDGATTLLKSRECRVHAGRLVARSGSETARLQQFIADCADGAAAGQAPDCREVYRLGDPALLMQVVPPAETPTLAPASERRLLSIFITDPHASSVPSAEQLRQRFGLTGAEAQVAGEIVKGGGLMQCAAVLKISAPTARTHLKRIFEKTGAERQAHFVRLGLASHLAIR